MYSERFKMQNRTAYKLFAICATPAVAAFLISPTVGIALLLACGLFVIVLKSLTFQITVEDDGIYKDVVQLPIGIGRSKLVDYTEIEFVEANPTENLMAEYVSPLYRYVVPIYSLNDSSDDILTNDDRYFGADVEGTVHIQRADGTEVRLSSRNATTMTSTIQQNERSNSSVESSQ
jgi:hypothetical protein